MALHSNNTNPASDESTAFFYSKCSPAPPGQSLSRLRWSMQRLLECWIRTIWLWLNASDGYLKMEDPGHGRIDLTWNWSTAVAVIQYLVLAPILVSAVKQCAFWHWKNVLWKHSKCCFECDLPHWIPANHILHWKETNHAQSVWLKSLITVIGAAAVFKALALSWDWLNRRITQHISKTWRHVVSNRWSNVAEADVSPTKDALKSCCPIADSNVAAAGSSIYSRWQHTLSKSWYASSNNWVFICCSHIYNHYLSEQGSESRQTGLVRLNSNPTIAEKTGKMLKLIWHWWNGGRPKAGFRSQTWKTEPLVLIHLLDHPHGNTAGTSVKDMLAVWT